MITVERAHEWYLSMSDEGAIMNLMTMDPAEVCPNGSVFYRFHESFCKLKACVSGANSLKYSNKFVVMQKCIISSNKRPGAYFLQGPKDRAFKRDRALDQR